MTKIAVMLIILLVNVYTLSYARFCWSNKKKRAAVGSVLLAAASIITPAVILLVR